MAYLNLDPDYCGHPKTKRIIGILGKRADIFPIRLWCYCAKYHPENGKLVGYSAEEIEGLVDWDGEKGLLTATLLKVGFLKKKGEVYEVNDWLDHEGHIVKFKERSKLANKKRWEKITPTRTPKEEVKESPLPNHTIPNLPNQYKYMDDLGFKKVFNDYLEMRRKIRKPATDRAKEIVLKKLHEYDLDTAVKMLEQSIVGSWQSVYELKIKEQNSFSNNQGNMDLLIKAKSELGQMAKTEDIVKWLKILPSQQHNQLRMYLLCRYPKDGDQAWGKAEVIFKRGKDGG